MVRVDTILHVYRQVYVVPSAQSYRHRTKIVQTLVDPCANMLWLQAYIPATFSSRSNSIALWVQEVKTIRHPDSIQTDLSHSFMTSTSKNQTDFQNNFTNIQSTCHPVNSTIQPCVLESIQALNGRFLLACPL